MAVVPDNQLILSRLVIVDDHELLATSLASMLRQLGLTVELACGPSVETVVEKVGQVAPALVLLDLELGPWLGSGLELIQPLIEVGGRVVMTTGERQRHRLAPGVEAGATAILPKSSGVADLHADVA